MKLALVSQTQSLSKEAHISKARNHNTLLSVKSCAVWGNTKYLWFHIITTLSLEVHKRLPGRDVMKLFFKMYK